MIVLDTIIDVALEHGISRRDYFVGLEVIAISPQMRIVTTCIIFIGTSLPL